MKWYIEAWCALLLAAGAASAQDMPGMAMPPPAGPAPQAMDRGMADQGAMAGMNMSGMNMDGMNMAGMAMMPAMLGSYAMMRESSGTSWQPDSSPMQGLMRRAGGWPLMIEGYANLLYDHQGGPRGGKDKTFSESMLMLMGNHAVSGGGRIGLRAMLSLDPLMGRDGYPLLLATGETADGRTELVDRQHPHDLLMELAASYAQDLGGGLAAYLYVGLPGEPALGPPTFMHRLSGMDNVEAPIGHHWFDSTHITFGVVTAGFSTGHWKLEGSAFKGREPDQHRWNFETPKLDSWSLRAFWNPSNLSLQASTGHLHSPEQLHPDENERRTTVSASYNLPLADRGNWASTIAWSLKDDGPGARLHAILAESALRLRDRHVLFARAEHVQERELFATGPLHDTVIPVSKLSLGYDYELQLAGPARLALGGLVSGYAFPDRIKPAYGHEGIKSFMLFARVKLAEPAP